MTQDRNHTPTAQGIISRWPSRREMAHDADVQMVTVHRWFARDSIPGEYDIALLGAARRRGIDLTLEDLARARAQRHADKTSRAA